MPNIKLPSATQMARFWKLVTERRISYTHFEKYLDLAEFGPALAPDDPATAVERLAFRVHLAEAGTAYLEVLFPRGAQNGVRLSNVLDREWYYPDFSTSTERVYIRTIRDLVAMPEASALRVKNLGIKSVQSLKARLAVAGLKLGMTPAQIEQAFDFREAVAAQADPPPAAEAL